LTEASTHMQTQQDSVAKAVSHYLLDIVQPRVISFEDQVIFLRCYLHSCQPLIKFSAIILLQQLIWS
jgi:hypothetical protein